MTQEDHGTLPQAVDDQLGRILAGPAAQKHTLVRELLAEHPQWARAIRARLAQLERIAGSTNLSVTEAMAPFVEKLGRYRVVGRLGGGGMGVVYEGVAEDDPSIRVALKIVLQPCSDAHAIARFQREMIILAPLAHPGIARLLDTGANPCGEGVLPWYSMELVDGGIDLCKYADKHQLDTRARVELLVQACDAVAYLHSKSVVHRDLKPSNILVSARGELKVIDFGIARLLGDTLRLTLTQQTIGTPRYLCPEGQGLRPDPRGDVWALGIIAAELLGGESVYDHQLRLCHCRSPCQRTWPRLFGVVCGATESIVTPMPRRWQLTCAHIWPARRPAGLPSAELRAYGVPHWLECSYC